jgi:iron-sulfur cluster insertion protein
MTELVEVDESARARVEALRVARGAPGLMLRVSVEGGGCSGFQYRMTLEETRMPDDAVFGECVVTDPVSLDFLKGARVVFEDSLAGSEFRIDNPNARSGCGCGVSFSI